MFPVIKLHWKSSFIFFFFFFTMNIIIIFNTPESEIRSRHITMYLFGETNTFNEVLSNHRINYAKHFFLNLPGLKYQFQYIFVEIKSEKNNPSPYNFNPST